MRRTAAEAIQTRDAIVAAARARFATDGYATTPLATIADDAGVTKGAVFHHFTDKRDLFRAVTHQMTAEFDAAVTSAASEAGDDTVAVFMAGCTAAFEQALSPDFFRIAAVEAPAVLGVDEWHRIDAEVGLRTMRFGLQLLDHDGRLAHPFSEALAVLLFGAMTEATIAIARAEPGTPTKEDFLAEFFRMVIRPERP